MSEQHNKKRGGILFIVVPVCIIGILIYFTQYEGAGSPGTQFTPEELFSIVDQFSVDNVAGECINKKFLQFENNPSNSGRDYTVYSYFYVGKKPTSYEKERFSAAKEVMIERITIWDNENGFYYTIKDKSKYMNFLNSIINEFDAQKYNELSHPSFEKNDVYYIIDNKVVIDDQYDIDYNGWGIYFTTIDELKRIHYKSIQDSIDAVTAKQILDSIAAKKAIPVIVDTPTVAYIAINLASAYVQPNGSRHLADVTKGTELTIIKMNEEYLYCDFIDKYDNPKTGWISKDDVKYTK